MHLGEQVKQGDTILVKASHFMNFGKIDGSITKIKYSMQQKRTGTPVLNQWLVLFQCFENLCSRILADMFLVLFGKFRWTEWFAVFQNYMVFSNLRKLFFKDRYGVVHSNRDNQTVSFSCQTKLPSWNSRSSRSLSFLFLVPSGKMQTEIPDLISSIPDRMVFSPFFISFRSRKRQWR